MSSFGFLPSSLQFLCWVVQSHVPFAHHGVANNRTSPWAAHFVVSNVNKDQDGPDGYTYDLEWSPDAINPPINQNVRGVPPTYIECVLPRDASLD